VNSIAVSIKKFILHPFYDVSVLIFPEGCVCCKIELAPNEKHLCGLCEIELKRTYFEEYGESTPLEKLFWGRVKLEKTFALYYFNSATAVREVLHQLKYQYKGNLGIDMGKKIGIVLNESNFFSDLDGLISVPIHHKKAFIRGYNQSELIAKGISIELGIPVLKNAVKKLQHTDSQTKKSKIERWENVNGIFKGENLKKFNHIAIVDDVITTGSTLESLAVEIQKENPHLKISIIALAFAKS
jgi:ComF family protein